MKFIFYSVITVIAIVSAVLAFRFSEQNTPPTTTIIQSQQPREVNIKTVTVLVARSNIAVGSIIDSSMIDTQPWPENLVLENFVLGDKGGQDIVGKVVRSAISAHEPFMKNKLANPNDPGFLAATLPAGMRAVTVATDTVSGVAGFVFPGDRVDLLYTHSSASVERIGRSDVTEVLGSNLRVLAVNLRDNDPQKIAPVPPSSVTLEVSDDMAQRIRLAEKNGSLSFSLRSIHDDSSTYPDPSEINDLSRMPSPASPSMVVRGPGSGGKDITFSVINKNISDNEESGEGKTTEVIRGTGSNNSSSSTDNKQVSTEIKD